MKRRHSKGDLRAINKHRRDAKESHNSFCANLSDGELRKKHPFDCGNPKCGVCHPPIKGEKKKEFDKIKEEKNL